MKLQIKIAFHSFIAGIILMFITTYLTVSDHTFDVWREWNRMTLVTCMIILSNSAMMFSLGIMFAEKMRKNQ